MNAASARVRRIPAAGTTIAIPITAGSGSIAGVNQIGTQYAADPVAGGPSAPQSAPAGPAPAATVPGGLPTDTLPGELVAEFRGRSRTISKK